MRIGLIFCSICFIPLSFLLYNSQGKREPASVVKRGTTIVLLTEKDSIIMASDSRNQVYTSDNSFYFTDTTNKIFKAGKFFFVFVGVESFGNTQLKNIVIKNYNPAINLEKNCDLISSQMAAAVQEFFGSITPAQKSFFDGNGINRYQVNLFCGGYEKNKPMIGLLKISIKKDGDGYVVSAQEPELNSFPYKFITAGYDDHIQSYLFSSGYSAMLRKNSGVKITDIEHMISLEAQNHQEIDSNVNYVIINRQGFKLGKNYK